MQVQGREASTIRKMHLLQEVISPVREPWIYCFQEMIHATDESVVASLIEVLTEILIQAAGTLGTLDDDKAHGQPLIDRIVELFQSILPLIMGDIDAIKSRSLRDTPHRHKAHAIGSQLAYKEMIEQERHEPRHY